MTYLSWDESPGRVLEWGSFADADRDAQASRWPNTLTPNRILENTE
jgi:hypothetical protein